MTSSFARLLPPTDDEQELLLRDDLEGPDERARADAALRLGATYRTRAPRAARRLLALALEGDRLTRASALLRLAYVAHREDGDDAQAREYVDEARAITSELAETAPGDGELLALRVDIATAFALLEQVQDATSLLWHLDAQARALHEQHDGRSDTWREMSASISLRLGELLRESGPTVAEEALRHSIAWGSGSTEATAALHLGWLLEHRLAGLGPETEEMYRHATELDDPIVAPRARVSLGDLLWLSGRPDKAREEWTLAQQEGDTEIRRRAERRLDGRWQKEARLRAAPRPASPGQRPVPVRAPTPLGRVATRRPAADVGPRRRKVVVVGAGTGGHYLLPGLRTMYDVCAFVDDHPRVRHVHGVPVRGTIDDLESVVEEEGADQIVFAIPTAPGSTRNRALDAAHRCGVEILTLPSMFELRLGHPLVPQLRTFEVFETFGDFTWAVDREAAAFVRGRRVAIAGAGTVMGKALARRVAHGHARHLLLLDEPPGPLMAISGELRDHRDFRDADPRIVDCTDPDEVAAAFADHPPEIVFFCAGMNYVPTPALSPAHAVRANVTSARVVAEAARAVGASDFVLASADRAAQRKSAFDFTKALAETAVLELATRAAPQPSRLQLAGRAGFRVSVLRLPNIWARDRGTVGRFTDQLRDGGPIYADPKVQRKYVPAWDAAEALLRLYGDDHKGGLFAYTRGEVLHMHEIAERLAKVHGLVADRDIQVDLSPRGDTKDGVYMFGEQETAEGEGLTVAVSQSDALQEDLSRRLRALLTARDRRAREQALARHFTAGASDAVAG